MFAISISFGPNNSMMSFLYNEEASFRTALENASNAWEAGNRVHIADSFGQHGCYNPDSIHAIFDEDLSASSAASIERSLHNTRMQIECDEIANKDPKIVAHWRAMQQKQRQAGIMAGNGLAGAVAGPWPRTN